MTKAQTYKVDGEWTRPISGNEVLDGSGDEHRILVDTNGYLQVDIITMPTVTETNSAAIKTALEIMDDWDSGDKCKVYLYGDDAGTARLVKVNASGELSVYTP